MCYNTVLLLILYKEGTTPGFPGFPSVCVYFHNIKSYKPINYLLGLKATYHTVDRQQLIPPLETPVSVGHTTRDDTRDVDRRVLLLPSHHVEAQPLLGLGQFYHTRVSMTFAGSKRRNRCFGGG